MQSTELDVDLDNVDDDGIAENQTPADAEALVLDGALGTTLDYARILLFTSAGDESGKTLTVVGKDADGNDISEVVIGPNTTAVTTLFYKVITSITTSAALDGNIKVGTRAATLVASSSTVPLNFYDNQPPTVSVDVTGTINFTVQQTFDDVLGTPASSATWASVTALASKSADTTASLTRGAKGVRVLINSYSNGAELQAAIISSYADTVFQIGTDVQAWDQQLADIAGLTPTDDGVIIGDGTNFVVEDGATLKTSLGLTIGTDVQAYSANLDAVAAVTVTSAGTALLDDANAAAQLVTLGVNATAAELNARTDDSAMVESVIAAGAVSVTVAVTTLDVAMGGAVTLAAPSKPAMIKVIKMTTDDGDVTLALTNVVGGSAATTATFASVGDTLVLVSDNASSGKWVVLAEVGVALT